MKLNRKKGFTIIELLLYMGIFSILLTVTLQMFSSVFDVQLESEATSSVAADGKYILNKFTYDVNRATSITTPGTFGSPASSLVLVIDGQTYTYNLTSGNLNLQNNTTGTTDRLNSSDSTVSNLSFIKLDGNGKDAVQMSFTSTSLATKRSGKQVVNYKTSAGLR